MKIKLASTLLFSLCILAMTGCGIYSFTGASIPPHLKRIHIPNFQDKSSSGILNLKEDLTELLTTKIITQSSFELGTQQQADCRLEGSVVMYTNQPYIISQGQATGTNRITVRVSVVYRDLIKKETIWEQNFENWAEYSIGDQSAEQEALKEATIKLTDDIFSKIVSNW
ncbi:MAG: LPS assembly lipoprotein LptE [Bacteroidetes bacterium]|nr:LPS assembly lipoprotein LptE [Bacteroidota bacterium]